ncbi:MAG TPA: hypothetical protein DIU37_02695 [Opitutae bacterium]|nr:hypothetical protein [Opitutae bacterium]
MSWVSALRAALEQLGDDTTHWKAYLSGLKVGKSTKKHIQNIGFWVLKNSRFRGRRVEGNGLPNFGAGYRE